MMTRANKLIAAAKKTRSGTAWRMIRGKFRKALGDAKLSWELTQSALRTFERIAPMPMKNGYVCVSPE
jgi:hypothetical protein